MDLAVILPALFPIVGAAFSALFMGMVIVILLRALLAMDVRDLFVSSHEEGMSTTKFWQNIAYSAGTLAFLALNVASPASTAIPLEMIWVIYLGIIGGNATLSKWIDAKYNGPVAPKAASTTVYGARVPVEYANAYRNEIGPTPMRGRAQVDNPDA